MSRRFLEQILEIIYLFSDCLPALERGDLKKDYNANTTNLESEDEEDPRTPTSVSSQGSQGYDSAGSDFVDIEGFSQITPIPDSSLPEINLQVSFIETSLQSLYCTLDKSESHTHS